MHYGHARQYLGSNPVTGAIHVLKIGGRLPDEFHRPDDRTEPQREALDAEEVTFDTPVVPAPHAN